MKRYIRSTTINAPAHFNIKGLDELQNFIGTRSEIYSLISKYNPLAIVDRRNALVKIDDISYLITLKKAEGGYKVHVIWQLYNEGKAPGGQYYLQEDRFRPL